MVKAQQLKAQQLGAARAVKGLKGSAKLKTKTSKSRSIFGYTPGGFIKSSNVDAVSYDNSTSQMLVRYKGGAEYIYFGIPSTLYDEIVTGQEAARTLDSETPIRFWPGKFPSVGAAMHWKVKVKGYRYVRIK